MSTNSPRYVTPITRLKKLAKPTGHKLTDSVFNNIADNCDRLGPDYLPQIGPLVAELHQQAQQLVATPKAERHDLGIEMYRHAHRLRGDLAQLGCPDASQVCREISDIIESAPLDTAVCQVLVYACQVLKMIGSDFAADKHQTVLRETTALLHRVERLPDDAAISH